MASTSYTDTVAIVAAIVWACDQVCSSVDDVHRAVEKDHDSQGYIAMSTGDAVQLARLIVDKAAAENPPTVPA